MTDTTGRSRTWSIAFCGLSIALLAVSAMVSVPLGPVPFTMQTAVLVIIVCLLTPGEAAATVGAYLLLGMVGLPIFSSMRGGIGVIAGPTGGFLIGFFFGAVLGSLVRSLIARRSSRHLPGDIAGSLVLEIISYVFGLSWLMVSSHMGFVAAFTVGALPFLVTDVIKVIVAIGVVQPVRKGLGMRVGKASACLPRSD